MTSFPLAAGYLASRDSLAVLALPSFRHAMMTVGMTSCLHSPSTIHNPIPLLHPVTMIFLPYGAYTYAMMRMMSRERYILSLVDLYVSVNLRL